MLHPMPIFRLFAIDSAVGRCDYESLSDQTLMEILIDGMCVEEKSKLQGEEEFFVEVRYWPGVDCIDTRVTKTIFHFRQFGAEQFPFSFIPPLVEHFEFVGCNLHGTLHTSDLPKGMKKFSVRQNKLHGEINFKTFPEKLRDLDITTNEFCGRCALEDLPDSIQRFQAYCNAMSGSIDLKNLPIAMEDLEIAGNYFTGPIVIEGLPQGIRRIDLSECCFSGEFRIMSFPPALESVSIIANEDPITAAVLRGTSSRKFFSLYCETIESVLDEHGNRHPWEAEILEENAYETESSSDDGW